MYDLTIAVYNSVKNDVGVPLCKDKGLFCILIRIKEDFYFIHVTLRDKYLGEKGEVIC